MRETRINGESNRDNGGLPLHLALTVAAPTYQMKPSDNVIIVTSAAADAAGIITLPSLAESVGQFYCVKAPTGATADDVHVHEKETGANLATYGLLVADNDQFVIFSNGVQWILIYDGVA